MHLEFSADGVAVALNEFSRALDSLYWERVKILTQEGYVFFLRIAEHQIQEQVTDLVGSGRYTPLQARALSAAFQSWRPPTKEEPNG